MLTKKVNAISVKKNVTIQLESLPEELERTKGRKFQIYQKKAEHFPLKGHNQESCPPKILLLSFSHTHTISLSLPLSLSLSQLSCLISARQERGRGAQIFTGY